jgi:hypothetical protein
LQSVYKYGYRKMSIAICKHAITNAIALHVFTVNKKYQKAFSRIVEF